MKRILLVALVALLTFAVALACADTEYHEAPMLAEKVAAGELPSVEERLPKEPFVATQLQNGQALEIGTYGGVLTTTKNGGYGNWVCRDAACLERPVDFMTDGTPFNNVLKDIQSNEDMTEWTMYLREGMKWSNGDPFTADDVTFWFYMLHKTNLDSLAYWTACFQIIDGETVWPEVIKVDDYTVTWKFAQPQYRSNFVDTGDMKWCWCNHNFWADKVPTTVYQENPYWEDTGLSEEEVLANFLKAGLDFATVVDAGKQCGYYSWCWAPVPTLGAYMLTTEEGFNGKKDALVKFVRNPYYFKVDAAGNQLPYIDEIDIVNTTDNDQAILMFESEDSKISWINPSIQDVLAIEEAMGDKVVRKELTSTAWGDTQLCFNLTNKDEELRTLVNNKNFRIAMSVAVDREQVVNLWYDGLTVPQNCAPQEGNFGYSEEWAFQHTKYDPEYAKKLLAEECGLTLGSDGWFYFPSGKKVALRVLTGDTGTVIAEKHAVLKQYWDAIGIEMDLIQTTDESTIKDSNENWDAGYEGTAMNGYKIESRPKQFLPLNLAASWYSFYDYRGSAYNPEFYDLEGDMLKLYNTYLEWQQIPNLEDRDGKELEMMQILIDNMWQIAYSSNPNSYYLVRSNIHNWPDSMPNEDKFNYQMQFGFATVFFAD